MAVPPVPTLDESFTARVLLVDDHPANLVALEAALAPLPIEVVRASSGREAIEHILRGDFAAAILDVQMPDLDGFETAALIRQREGTREIPIIFVSALRDDEADFTKGYAHGAVDYLAKPFNVTLLRAKVAALVDLWRRGETLRRREALFFEQERADLRSVVQQTEDRLRLVIDAIPGLVAYMNPDQTYRLINRAYEAWFGVPAEQILGRRMPEVLGEGSYRVVQPHVEAALSGQRVTFEAEVPFGTDETRWVQGQYIPHLGPDGTVHGYISLVLDITAAKRAAEQLAEEARLNESLYRISTSLAANLDLDTIFNRLTEEATALCRAEFGAFFYNVSTPERGSYMLYTLAGVPREAFAGFPMPRNTDIFAPTFAGTHTMRSDDITQDPRYGRNAPYHGMPRGHLPVRSYLAVPVVSRSGEVHGGLFFGHSQPGVFTSRDEHLMVAAAAHAAAVIDNARLHATTVATEEKYRALTESSPQLVWTTTADGAIEYCNSRFEEFVGMSLQEMRQGPAWDRILHGDDASRAATAWAHAVASGEPYEVEYRLRRAQDGSHRWFLARGVPVRDGSGRIIRWVGACTDIDERKRAEDVQRLLAETGTTLASSLDYRSTLSDVAHLLVPGLADWCGVDLVAGDDGALDHLVVAHADPHKLQAVDAIARRYPPLPDSPVVHVIRSGRAMLIPELDDELLTRRARDAEHLSLLRALGLRSWMAAPILVHGNSIGVIWFASAESRRRLGERDLAVAEEIGRRCGVAVDNARLFDLARRERNRAEEANRAKDLFLGSLSHELRTPLTAIVGWARMLRSGALSAEQQQRALETIDRNARAQAALIEDILDLSRITSGKIRLNVVAVEIAQVVETALDTVRPGAEAKGVRIQAVLDPDAGTLHGDATRLQQICWNLFSNAVKFTPKGGRVYVRLERTASQIELLVADTGRGIAPDFLPRVFERFMQADSSSTREHGGLGLGLAIVKHLVELHGGTVRAESAGPGQGATFVVRLPVAPVRSTPAPELRPQPLTKYEGVDVDCPPELDGLRVLLVDDEPDARELMCALLESCHARVVTAGSVAEALAQFEAEPPDLLVSDVGMPGEDGYSLIRKIRALPLEKGGSVPAVAVTAYAATQDRTRALLEGFTNHVSKPTEPQELLAVVAAAAGRHRRSS